MNEQEAKERPIEDVIQDFAKGLADINRKFEEMIANVK